MATDRLVIRGGADEYQAVAILAVIQQVLDEEAAARSRPPVPKAPPAWVRLGTPAPFGRFAPPVKPEPGRTTPT